MGVRFYNVTQVNLSSTGDSDATVNNVTSSTHTPREKVTLSDLPYQQNKANIQAWHNAFVPALLRWAGAQEDPFGTNSKITEVVHTLWGRIFPNNVLNKNGLSTMEAVVCP
jgi:hypothetical protein